MLSSFAFDLSTSQMPTRLAAPHFAWSEARAALGGGFGAVTRPGVGVCYQLLREQFVLHVHSWRSGSSPAASSRLMCELIERALFDMCDLFAAAHDAHQ